MTNSCRSKIVDAVGHFAYDADETGVWAELYSRQMSYLELHAA
jgi:phenylalanine-4-hydroxylase